MWRNVMICDNVVVILQYMCCMCFPDWIHSTVTLIKFHLQFVESVVI